MSVIVATDWRDALRAEDACSEAMDFAARFETFQAAWDVCERGDWMLWWIGRMLTAGPMSSERRPLVRIACACARLASPYVKACEERPRLAIELAERWANGDDTVTREQMRVAASAASAAYAAYAAAAAAAHRSVRKQCADFVRRKYPHPLEVMR